MVFPAYAGVILTGSKLAKVRMRFPRIRGGDPDLYDLCDVISEFSPHTRG